MKILTTILALICFQAQAQINYVDFVPDYFQNKSGVKKFDLDNNGIYDLDFELTIIDPNFDIWFTLSTSSDVEVAIDTAVFNFVKRIGFGHSVTAQPTWKSAANIPIAYLTSGTPEGNWPGSMNGYIGFRWKVGPDYRYGWLQIDVHSMVNDFTITEYAYETTLNSSINAGQKMSTGIAAFESMNEPFVFLMSDNRISIQSLKKGFNIQISSIDGKQIQRQFENDDSLEIDLRNLTSGIYIISAANQLGIFHKKILIP